MKKQHPGSNRTDADAGAGAGLSVRDRILAVLAENPETLISGQQLADACGVSRTAIWKAVSALRAAGYSIDAAPKAGYRLTPSADILSPQGLLAALKKYRTSLPAAAGLTADMPVPAAITVYKTTDSTNTRAKKLLAEQSVLRAPDGTLTAAGERLHTAVILAGEQTEGRGRLGRSFYSPPESGLYLSLIYSPAQSVREPACITAAAAVAVCRALTSLYQVTPAIKWVNDIFLDGKKICGILTEGMTSLETGTIDTLVIGIGINLRNPHTGFPGDLSAVAGSVQQAHNGQPDDAETVGIRAAAGASGISRNDAAAAVVHHLLGVLRAAEAESGTAAEKTAATAEEFSASGEFSTIMDEYKRRSLLPGKTVLVSGSGEPYEATVIDIDRQAHLIVEIRDGTRKTLHSGEVSLSSASFTR